MRSCLSIPLPGSLPSRSAYRCPHPSPCAAAVLLPTRWSGLAEHVASNVDDWKRIYDSLEPQNELQHLPAPWGDKLELFQKILVLRLLRPDKVEAGAGGRGRGGGKRWGGGERARQRGRGRRKGRGWTRFLDGKGSRNTAWATVHALSPP